MRMIIISIWIGTSEGVYKAGLDGQLFLEHYIENEQVRCLF